MVAAGELRCLSDNSGYGLVGYDRVKKLPALIEDRNYPRSTPAVSALYP